MNIDTLSWKSFAVQIPIRRDKESLYRAWATPEGIESWFLRSAIYISKEAVQRKPAEPVQKGDHYQWLWHGYSDEVLEARTIIDLNGRDLFQFEFTGDCLVTVNFEKAGEMTLVKLTQDGIPEDNNPATNLFVGCQLGWTFYLTNLKSVMEGGLDLRNRDLRFTHVINS
jgi:hypothetical protein